MDVTNEQIFNIIFVQPRESVRSLFFNKKNSKFYCQETEKKNFIKNGREL